MLEYIFCTIIDQNEWKNSFENVLSKYPFDINNFDIHEQMIIKTVQGDNVLEQILEKLGKSQNIFLIGEYGAGKTFLTYSIIRTILEHQEVYPYFSFWFKLSERSKNVTYETVEDVARTFVEDGLKQYRDFLIDVTRKRRLRILVILDKLDEIVSGLGESELKLLLLKYIYQNLYKKYRDRLLFIVTSREIDFKSCMGSQKEISFLDKFVKIFIGDCEREDAIQKLQAIEKKEGWTQEKNGFSITQNTKLVNIAKKPLYFGFIREFILDHSYLGEWLDELDVLQAIIKKSVRHYVEYNSIQWKKRLLNYCIIGLGRFRYK